MRPLLIFPFSLLALCAALSTLSFDNTPSVVPANHTARETAASAGTAAAPAEGPAIPTKPNAAPDTSPIASAASQTKGHAAGPAPMPPDPADYIYPVLDVQRLYAANFGEMRPNHFHSGIDIKTDGTEGKPLVAVADGYVSRIVVSPSGYGRALYLALDNGTTAVYGHLARFRDDIEAYVQTERERLRRNRVDLACPPGLFPVAQGDRIGHSGNSGSSFGPHLHFEVRETASQRALNPVRLGIIRPTDDMPPRIIRILYIETDTVQGIPVHRAPVSYAAERTDPHTYRLVRKEPVPVGANGSFVVEATDRRNGVSNTFGLYRATLSVDGIPHFEYRMDGFTFDRSRDCNAAAYYPVQLTSRNEAIRLAALEGACTDFCPVRRNRGAVGAAPGQRHSVRIETEDDCGNIARLDFQIEGRTPWQAPFDPSSEPYLRQNTMVFATDSVRLTLFPGSLYEAQFVRIGPSPARVPPDSTLVILSPAYRMLPCTTPLRQAVEVSITADIPEALRPHAVLAAVDHRGRLACVGGRWMRGDMTARTTTTGDLLVVADTMPPTVRPLFTDGGDLSAARRLAFRIADNFSGIVTCELWIDGRWAVCDRFPMQGTAVHRFTEPPAGRRHTVRLALRDGCGNETVWEGAFLR